MFHVRENFHPRSRATPAIAALRFPTQSRGASRQMASCASSVNTRNSLQLFCNRLLTVISILEDMTTRADDELTFERLGSVLGRIAAKLKATQRNSRRAHLDVPPTSAVADAPNSVGAYAETDSKIDVKTGEHTDGAHFALREFCDGALFATLVATLRHFIGHVVVIRASEQMIRVDAATHVALVEDMHPFGNIPTEQHPRLPMRALKAAVDLYSSVAGFINRPQPKPTTGIRLWNEVVHEPL